MLRNIRSRILIIFLCTFLLVIVYTFVSNNQIVGSIQETKINISDKSKQKSIAEFSKERKKYSYVSFDNLYENTTLYYGSKIYQYGHIKKLDTEHKYLLVALDGNDASKTIKLKYDLSSFAKNDSSFQENDPIKFYGKVLTIDRYVNEKGRTVNRPIISADFIQTKFEKQGDNYGIV